MGPGNNEVDQLMQNSTKGQMLKFLRTHHAKLGLFIIFAPQLEIAEEVSRFMRGDLVSGSAQADYQLLLRGQFR